MLVKNPPEFTEAHWVEQCKPVANPYNPGMGFDYGDGSCLMLYTDLQKYINEHNLDGLNDDRIFSVIEAENDMYLSQGYHWVNSFGYIVTQHPPRFPLHEDILID